MYYFPGMWDWSPDVVLPLVRKGFLRSIREANAEQGNTEQRYVEQGAALLEHYVGWAPTVDEFAPVKIDHDVEGLVPDPRDPERGLVTRDGGRVLYTTRVDLLAIDAADTYWAVRHQVVPSGSNWTRCLSTKWRSPRAGHGSSPTSAWRSRGPSITRFSVRPAPNRHRRRPASPGAASRRTSLAAAGVQFRNTAASTRGPAG
jgi:hypothetical protein